MSIDVHHETLLTLAEVPSYLAARNVIVARRTVYDWIRKGPRGKAILETVEIGRRLYTSVEALQRHAERNRRPRGGPSVSDVQRADRLAAELMRSWGKA